MHARDVGRVAGAEGAVHGHAPAQLLRRELAQVLLPESVRARLRELLAHVRELRAVERHAQAPALDEVRFDVVLGDPGADLIDGVDHRALKRRVAARAARS